MKIKNELLKSAIGLIGNVPTNPGFQTSQFVKVTAGAKKLRLALTGVLIAEATIPVDVTESWEVVLSRDNLFSFVQAMTASADIDITVKKDGDAARVTLSSKGHKISIASKEELTSAYQQWKAKESEKISIAAFKSEAGLMAQYAPDLDVDGKWANILFIKKNGIVTTNTKELVAVMDGKVKATTLIPPQIARVAADLDASEILTDGNGYGVVTDTGYVYQPKKHALSEYPQEEMQAMMDAGLKAKPSFVLPASKANDMFTYLRNFASEGAKTKVQLTASKAKGSVIATLRMYSVDGSADRNIKVDVTSDMSVTIPLMDVLPWFGYMAKVGGDVEFSRLDDPPQFIASLKLEGKAHLLISADSSPDAEEKSEAPPFETEEVEAKPKKKVKRKAA